MEFSERFKVVQDFIPNINFLILAKFSKSQIVIQEFIPNNIKYEAIA